MTIPSVADLLASNRAWAAGKTKADPGFFKRLVSQQTPAYFWIGCADSRVPANEIVGVDPGEMFVHRNVANLAPPQDANYLSVLQYAVQVLKVQHILVVGHYGCGGVLAALNNLHLGLIDHWLSPIRTLVRAHSEELLALPTEKQRHDRLCELNVLQQVENVATNPFVLEAWEKGADLTVHGWCYSIENGLITDLGARLRHADELGDLDNLR
jgi:carbonic anhydrase